VTKKAQFPLMTRLTSCCTYCEKASKSISTYSPGQRPEKLCHGHFANSMNDPRYHGASPNASDVSMLNHWYNNTSCFTLKIILAVMMPDLADVAAQILLERGRASL